jgi:hypothetical protein
MIVFYSRISSSGGQNTNNANLKDLKRRICHGMKECLIFVYLYIYIILLDKATKKYHLTNKKAEVSKA